METTFHILLHVKTTDGHETFGKFDLGGDRAMADYIFRHLKGDSDVTDQCGLCLEFIEMRDNLPYNVRMLSCTLDQLAENCRVITKETFKRLAV
ncbi:hypothetical protein [Chitinophaga rhizophila]|uniref:Uncharacterized protein n=1 Tax=Chitinophaga rhizophila TaxID=2866212 RepID=A0ABS7GGZ4_9BACT|nr:hypothetical protein [Chitinophaga rhizophila]MBW8686965.1 hypothetical protein [Chitinophaga rhizophila]